MKLLGVLPFARFLLERSISPGDIAVDCTAGNGHDSLFLAKLVRENGHVYSVDVQETAILNTRARLDEAEVSSRVTLTQSGHQHIATIIPSDQHARVKGAIFNLGYLPGGDKSIVTQSDTTIEAIEALLELMPKEGVIVLVIYHGHTEGAVERDHLLHYVENLDQKKAHVLNYSFINQANHPPFVVAIEKR
ncbi:class I SAM-dependent methyltransferase [Alkalihalophilus lindianensis]|uniref:Class I SAM-dependent methyltransferase n=1 Tax=Alkalihalophilus lindianensis TaxID=1630542 RepID=A0ABU3XEQ9_9BACI|nr:class I SAM-dependent methyltransferase [Alkalihalophilus lindianensis]MDV2686378.1 class I SAM-dependent methyltransferase [Alkalihalophilus lindianensis]